MPLKSLATHHGGEALACPAVFGHIDDLPLLIQVGHTLLGEGGPDDVAGQVLHGRFIVGDGIIFGNRLLEKDLQGFPGATAEIGKKLPVVEEISKNAS